MRQIREEIDAYFGGDVPSGVRVVWEPGAVWDASFDRGAGVVTMNAASPLRTSHTAKAGGFSR